MRDEVKEIFIQAMELPREQWPAFLDQHCAGKPEVRAEVEDLLSAHTHAGEFLAGPTVLPASETATSEASPEAQRQIGPYKLIKIIGEGGFGTVYLAEQEQPVRRRVALKIIKLGMDTQQVIARFEAERQALAMMEHPNIARVIDAGATSTGRPYFVMELVKGEPVTEYCDKNHVPIQERLELFAQVCAAVQHAH
ncbi:MAG TPA: protein kinase, partial [Tepidisphaeraceae bacterium]